MTATLTTLINFTLPDGESPRGSLIADANGDLFGTTLSGGANGDGTVFEIAKTAGGCASTPTTFVSFNEADGLLPEGSLIADANGDLFGTTEVGGANGEGTVFEIAKTAGAYASTPTTLVTFNGADGSIPAGSLIADASGDLLGTTATGGANGDGTVFEIVKTPAGYASNPVTLVNFDGADGADPAASLIADASGDLFGTTEEGGPDDDGTVFEIAKTPTGYASTQVTLVNFNFADGASPRGSLIADASGDLFGTTREGGAVGQGTVFEIAKTSTGYASTPTTLVSFETTGANPLGSLIADTDGDLFGTTSGGGADGQGTVFEITGSGFVPAPPTTVTSDIVWQNTSGQASIWDMNGSTLVGGGPVSPNPGPSWTEIGAGDFQPRRPFRHLVAEREHGPSLDLGDEREQLDRRRARDTQSRTELESHRERRFH
jgi:uncharacterized repeat protein (TIGR03803 family)